MERMWIVLTLALVTLAPGVAGSSQAEPAIFPPIYYTVHPIGWIRKSAGKTFIEIDTRYQPALMGVEELRSIWVLYWFDRNDTPEKRSVLQVHPRGNPDTPLRGVFATRSPLRPNDPCFNTFNILQQGTTDRIGPDNINYMRACF